MNGKVFNVQSFSTHDGPGIRTTVFMMGCSLKCRWCHNPEGLNSKLLLQYNAKDCLYCKMCEKVCTQNVHQFVNEKHVVHFDRCILCQKCIDICPSNAVYINGKEYSAEELSNLVAKDNLFYKNNGGVTFSGGECLLQADFVRECARMCKEKGVPTVAIDTAGNVPWQAFEKVLPYTDYFLYDVKAYSETCHKIGTGQSNKRILENLRKLDQQDKKIYIRIPLIPTVNDYIEEIKGVAQFISTLENIVEVRVLPYHTFGREKYEMLGYEEVELFPTPSDEEVAKFQQLFNR